MIQKQVMDYLRTEYDSGMTQDEIAKKHNIIQSQIQKILSGERTAGGITLQTLDKMFPKAEIYLEGNSHTINAQGNAYVNHVRGGNIDQSQHNVERNGSKLLSEILRYDKFSAEEKVKFMQFVEEKNL